MKKQTENSTLLNAIMESPDGIMAYFLDVEYKFVRFSYLFAQFVKENWGADLVPGMSVFDIKGFIADPKKACACLAKVFNEGTQKEVYDYFDHNFLRISIECIQSAVYHKKEPGGILVFVRDITQKRRTGASPKLTFEHQLLILRSLPLVFYTGSLDHDYYTTWISDQVEILTGYKPNLFVENHHFWTENLHPDDKERSLKEYNSILEKGFIAIEYRWKCANGSYRWFLDQITLSYNDHCEPTNIVGVWMDITKRKEEEENLQKSETKYRQLFDNANDVIIILEPKTETILEANLAAFKTYGFEPQELIGMSLKKLTKNVPAGEKQIQELITKGLYHDFETVQFNKAGEKIHFLINSTMIEYNGKKAILSLNRNITDKKKAEIALKNIEQSYSGLFNSVTEAIYIQDVNGCFIDVNQGVEKMYGYSSRELIGKDPGFLAAPDKNDMAHISFLLHDTFRTGKSHKFEFWGKRKNGEIFPKDVVCNKGKFLGKDVIITTARDVSERRKSEQALIESEARLKLAIESGKLGIWEWTTATGEFKVNAYFFEMFGFPNQGIEPKFEEFLSYIHPDDLENTIALIRHHIDKKTESFQTEHRFRTYSGDYKWIRAYGKVIEYNEDGSPLRMTGSIIDVDTLKTISIQLHEVNEFKDKLMSVIAHDLRSPFNSLLGFSQLVAENIESYPFEKSKKYILQINTTAKQTLSLLDNLIAWYKSQTGMLSFNPGILGLDSVIDQIITLCSSSAKIKNIALEVSKNKPLDIYADEDMLKTILRNLIYNSIKFTNPGGKILISTKATGQYIQITIADNGTGMSKEKLDSIFKQSAKLSADGTSNEKGFGLGLLLCKDFIDMHKGKIWARSKIGHGSRFYIEFPVVK